MWNRSLKQRLVERAASPIHRVTVVTGARQVGKTTLVRATFPDLPYISLDDPLVRPEYARWTAADWVARRPRAVLDEVQKLPALVDSIKAAHDRDATARYLLLGSSQILLLERVKESLAGRAAIEELWPLTLPELDTTGWDDPVRPSRWISWLQDRASGFAPLEGMPLTNSDYSRHEERFQRYLLFGGLPVAQRAGLGDAERERWLVDYRRTFLERDVADLVQLRDLEPFTRAQHVIATRTARLVNWSDLARSAGVSPDSARRFLRYLELSYQVLQLPPWFRNPEKRLAKAPKVHFTDPGVLRAVLDRRGEPTGEEFESAVVAELYKQLRNAALPARVYHLRTYDGREVDLLVELDEGFVAVEIKLTRRVARSDARHLHDLAELLDKPLMGALVLSRDRSIQRLDAGILAAPAAWVLSPAG